MARSTRTGGKGAGENSASGTETPNTDPANEGLKPPSTAGTVTDDSSAQPMGPLPEGEILSPEHPAEAVSRVDDAVGDAVEVHAEAAPEAGDGAGGPAQDPVGALPDHGQVAADTAASDTTQVGATAAAPPPPVPPPPARPSFVPMVLGGVIAAALGYAVAWTDILPRPPDPALSTRVDTVTAAQAAQDTRLTGLASDLGDLAARPVEDSDARGRIDEAIQRIDADIAASRAMIEHVESRVEGIGSDLEALADRLTALEDRPQVTVALSDAAQAAVEAQIAALRREAAEAIARVEADRETLGAQSTERFDALQAELRAALAAIEAEQASLQAARAEAATEAQSDRQAAAVASLRAALDAGGPYSEPLQALADLTGAATPPALAEHAADGIPSLAVLRETFPDAARAGLDAALRAQMDAGEVSRVEGFMRIHSGARSLTPQDGDSPDALLSRAEAALADADLDGTLALIDTLPPEGRSAMQAWVDQAETRRAALSALDALGDS